MVPHLFRIRCGEASKRRPSMAPVHSHGRVLPERPLADVDRLVSAASAALVSRRDGRRYACNGTGARLDAVSPAPMAHCVLLYRDAVADRRNPERELYIFELSRTRTGRPLAG